MTERRKRLIEVAFPLEEVSEYSRLDPYQGEPHPRVIHLWWARRPLAACRAFIYASLVNDPETETEREELLKEVADLSSWDAVRKPETVVRAKPKGSGLTGQELLRRARERILRDNDGKPPKLLDPFAGGGAIPLEALRLGCEVEASDLNPVAVLILKATVEYPQKYGRPLAEQREKRPDDCAGVNGQVPQYIRDLDEKGGRLPGLGDGAVQAYERNPLATDLRYWGHCMLEKARDDLAELYPPDHDGAVPVAYLWSRTVPCPNCGAEMPLIRQFVLSRSAGKRVELVPSVVGGVCEFEVHSVPDESEEKGTTAGGDAKCLGCAQVTEASQVRELARTKGMKETPTAVVTQPGRGASSRFRSVSESQRLALGRASTSVANLRANGSMDLPNEPIDPKTLGLRIDEFGLTHWDQLFNDRQTAALASLLRAQESTLSAASDMGLTPAYLTALSTYLAFVTSRLARENCVLGRWNPSGNKVQGAFGKQVISMVWDYAEVNPFGGSVGDVRSALAMIVSALELSSAIESFARVSIADARERKDLWPAAGTVVTDPPYYAAVDYAGLSDFVYVWLKRALGRHHDFLGLPLTPKKDQAIMASESGDRQERERYVRILTEAFAAAASNLSDANLMGVVFASAERDGWATLIESLLADELVPVASWPLDTESQSKLSSANRSDLKTSVWMACRNRDADSGVAFLDDLRVEVSREVQSKLLDFWRRGIRGADFFISAIGPALAVFGRHSKVLHPDGTEVSVREFLDIVRQESARVALQQVLHGENLGAIDPATRAYVMWVWSYGKAALDAGEAIAHCLATGADLGDITRPHAIAETAKDKSKKVVKLRSIATRAREDEELGGGNGARSTPLIDELQHAAHLWGAGKAANELPKYRATLGEERWKALRVLGQAVAECLPDGDDDRRIILGLLGSGAASGAAPAQVPGQQTKLEI